MKRVDGEDPKRQSPQGPEAAPSKVARIKAPYRAVRRQVYLSLEHPLKAKLPGKIIGLGLIGLIAANAVLVGTVGMDLPPNWTIALAIFTHFSTISFAIEYFCRLWIADMAYPTLTPARARLKYATSPLGIIDLLAFAPMIVMWYVPLSGGIIAAIRVIRLMRLVKISRYMRGLHSIIRVAQRRHREIVASFLAIMLLCVVASVLMYEAEHDAQPDKFTNVFTGMYWAVTTVTGTGYGDLVPITPMGRVLGSVTMLLSVALAAIPAGIFSSGFIVEFRRSDGRERNRREKEMSADQNALQEAIEANDAQAAVDALYRLLHNGSSKQ